MNDVAARLQDVYKVFINSAENKNPYDYDGRYKTVIGWNLELACLINLRKLKELLYRITMVINSCYLLPTLIGQSIDRPCTSKVWGACAP